MAEPALHIAWLGAGPNAKETGGVPGVAAELLAGFAALGHRVDCFLPVSGGELPPRLEAEPNLRFVRGTIEWRYSRWYSRGTARDVPQRDVRAGRRLGAAAP